MTTENNSELLTAAQEKAIDAELDKEVSNATSEDKKDDEADEKSDDKKDDAADDKETPAPPIENKPENNESWLKLQTELAETKQTITLLEAQAREAVTTLQNQLQAQDLITQELLNRLQVLEAIPQAASMDIPQPNPNPPQSKENENPAPAVAAAVDAPRKRRRNWF